MSFTGNAKIAALVLALALGFVAKAEAQGRPPLRAHTATQSQTLALVSATRSAGRAWVKITEQGTSRIIKANGVPDHKVGRFPNRGNPHRIKAQSYRFAVPLKPKPQGAEARPLKRSLFGVALNGVPFDPAAAEFWQGNPRSGWQYEALGGAVSLGLDANYGHVQPNGAYHYHGLPIGLLNRLGWSTRQPSPLVGYAADGFPIYAITAVQNGQLVEMTSSYQLKPGRRPAGGPAGEYDGTFVQDYIYVAGSGRLDACNGAVVSTPEAPQGTYAYFLTEAFPVIPRCHKGTPDLSFRKRR
ncbi:YHYH protein [Shimia sp. R11_0]|uniref:YHYH protein n=1 Tax=Shimia sp. R11_0 TaxID=2821096 RepID=UPI001ADC1B34|nr:YHYH protein [Shimia sp. R11_0]MBO9478110.1 YHYH protein [Shimia sp. R11_0]